MKLEVRVENVLPGDFVNEHLVLEVKHIPETELVILVITDRQTHYTFTTLKVERPSNPSLYDKEKPVWDRICRIAQQAWDNYWAA